jgi:hypothetical protein
MLIIYNDITKCIYYQFSVDEYIDKHGCNWPALFTRIISHEVYGTKEGDWVELVEPYPESHHLEEIMKPRFYQGQKDVVDMVECKCPRCERRYARLLFYTGHRPMRAFCPHCSEQVFVLQRPVEDIYTLNVLDKINEGG